GGMGGWPGAGWGPEGDAPGGDSGGRAAGGIGPGWDGGPGGVGGADRGACAVSSAPWFGGTGGTGGPKGAGPSVGSFGCGAMGDSGYCPGAGSGAANDPSPPRASSRIPCSRLLRIGRE